MAPREAKKAPGKGAGRAETIEIHDLALVATRTVLRARIEAVKRQIEREGGRPDPVLVQEWDDLLATLLSISGVDGR